MPDLGNRLEGKVAVVTGAGATGSGDFVGIGQAISILFARQGAKVLLVDRDEKNAETTLANINEEGGARHRSWWEMSPAPPTARKWLWPPCPVMAG